MRAFLDEISVDDMMYEMPGDDGDFEYEVVMLIGAQPAGVPAGSEKPTAHLRVTMYTNESLSVFIDNLQLALSLRFLHLSFRH